MTSPETTQPAETHALSQAERESLQNRLHAAGIQGAFVGLNSLSSHEQTTVFYAPTSLNRLTTVLTTLIAEPQICTAPEDTNKHYGPAQYGEQFGLGRNANGQQEYISTFQVFGRIILTAIDTEQAA